jgi:hypothetical protein
MLADRLFTATGLRRPTEQLEAPENKENPDGQRPIAAGPIFECFA